MEDHIEGKRLIAGSNCYFDYSKFEEFKRKQDALAQPPADAAKAPKKKKKKKSRQRAAEPAAAAAAAASASARFSVGGASLADPSADYPESRVIKMGPDGDLVVESLEDEYPRKASARPTRTMVPPVGEIPAQLADRILALDADQRAYWAALPAAAQKQMFTVEASAVSASMRRQQKALAARNGLADGAGGHEHSWTSNPRCYCPRCERNDLHIVGLIEEGFDTYMDELLDGLWEQFELQGHAPAPGGKYVDVARAESAAHDRFVEAQNLQRFAEIRQISSAGTHAGESAATVRNLELFYYIENVLAPSLQRTYAGAPGTRRTSSRQRQLQVDTLSCVHQILCLIQRMNERTRSARGVALAPADVEPVAPAERQRMAVADNLVECLHSFSREGLGGIAKAVEFVKILATVGRAGEHSFPDVTEQMAKFADMFQHNDGQSFVDVVAQLKAAEAAEHLEEEDEDEDEEDEEDPELEHYALKNPFSHCKCEFHTQLSEQFEAARTKALHGENHAEPQPQPQPDHDVHEIGDESDHDDEHDCEYDDHDEDCHDCQDCHDYDHDHDHEHDDHDDHDHLSEDDVDSAAEEEEAEERRFKELRGFFFMEVRKIIAKRFEESYKKSVSEDRTRKFIEELEAEENAKKEKELKKLKSIEKQKEKKRLQLLEKEERRKQKEAEDEAKAAVLRQKQEALRAEQKRREDEIRLKKEQEKMKKIEALRQKEQASLESKLKAQKAAEEEEKARVLAQAQAQAQAEAEAQAQAQTASKETPIASPQEPSKPSRKTTDTSRAMPESKKKPASERHSTKQSLPVKQASSNAPANRSNNVSPKQTANSNGKQRAAQEEKKVTGKAAARAKPSSVDNINPDAAHLPINIAPPQAVQTTPRKSNGSLTRKDADVSPKQTEPLLDNVNRTTSEADAGVAFAPPKNHLLEQLYHARPKTVSASGDSPEFFTEQAAASRMGTGYSPSKKSLSAYQPDTWNLGNGNQFQNESILPPSLDRPQFLNNVSGNANTWNVRNPSDGFPGAPIASPLMSNLPTSTMWSTNYPSRGNSIWGSNPAVNPESNKSSIWGTQAPQTETKRASFVGNTKEIVQSAAFKAIQEVRAAKETHDGNSSAMKIFQGARAILNDQSLKMSEFLSALHSSTKYVFEIVYDDFGSVTDIKASLQPERIFGSSTITNRSPSPQQAFLPSQFQPQAPFGQLDAGLQYPGFAPNALPMNQAMGQPPFQPALSNPANGAFQPPIGMNPHFPQNPAVPSQQVPTGETPNFRTGSFRGSSDNLGQFDSKISETMQGSLNQLGIGQVRGGIW